MLDPILARLRSQPSRTGSLIITLYGDAIAPRGGCVWLGTLLALFRAMGVADGVVRTAVSRLAADDWMVRRRLGRNSFYALSERGRAATEAATPLIYDPREPPWGGRFRLVLVEPGPEREALRQGLAAAGYGTAGAGVLVAPDSAPAPEPDGPLCLLGEADEATARRLAARAWPLDDVAARYRRFLQTFAADGTPADAQEAMVARMVLVHEWRRVVLRDPGLPAAILPPDWPGHAARSRAAALYEALYTPSKSWLDAHGSTPEGPLPAATPDTRRQFGLSGQFIN